MIVVVDIEERCVTTYYFLEFYVCFCNFRLNCTLYENQLKRKYFDKNDNIVVMFLWGYNVVMIKFASISDPTKPKSKEAKVAAYGLAFIYVVFALAQLYTLDNFFELFASYNLPLSLPLVYVLCCFIIVLEIFSLPFLLGSRTSKLMRFSSMVNGWFVVVIWFILELYINFNTINLKNVGFLGNVVDLTPGVWAILFPVALGILTIWASWGMWPKSIIDSKNSR